MLFPYRFLENHSIYKLQEWVDQIFLDVWCEADSSTEYSIELLPDEIKDIVLDIYNNDRIQTDYLYGPIETVYNLFKTLSSEQKESLKDRYIRSKEIERLCKNYEGYMPFRSSDLIDEFAILQEPLKKFFISLWEGVLNLSIIQKTTGSLNSYYNDFIEVNSSGICPYCGLSPLDEADVKTREAYDHYLPKSIYPFLSVNFQNLAPMCHKCNSGNKGNKDPLFNSQGNRRKAFFMFSGDHNQIQIQISLTHRNYENLKSEDIEIELGPQKIADELETWNELFNIKNRFKSTCCKENDGKYWITQIIEEYEVLKPFMGNDFSKKQFLQMKLTASENNPYTDKDFLRNPFLVACNEKGMFD